jgi:hypothetical protein
LIPDLYFDVKLPLERPYTNIVDPTAPTLFSDVLLSINICNFMHPFINAPAKKAERMDPVAVAAHAQRFQDELIDKLPPVFRLQDPDTSWDLIIPCLPKKRATVHVVIWGVVGSMYKGFIGSLVLEDDQSHKLDAKALLARNYAESYKKLLVNACLKSLEATFRLHELMGGGSHRYFGMLLKFHCPLCSVNILSVKIRS